jgi:hypothetical protein
VFTCVGDFEIKTLSWSKSNQESEIRMRRDYQLVLGIVVTGASLVGIVRLAHHSPATSELRGRLQTIQERQISNTDFNREKKATLQIDRARENVNYGTIFYKSRNYWSFAQNALSAAKAGDRDAQFYLAKALRYCAEANAAYFQKNGQKLGLDEGLQYAAEIDSPIDLVQAIFEKCHEFQDRDTGGLGNATSWLSSATNAGQPAAQATTAFDMLMQRRMQGFVAAGAVQTPATLAPTITSEKDIHTLVQEAAVSQDPEALFVIGLAVPLLNPTSSNINTDRFALMLVACERGYDCSQNAPWVQGDCLGRCDTSNPSNLVRSLSGDGWPDVQQRAAEINAALDSGTWSNLGIGS